MYQTDALCGFGQWKISTATNVESGFRRISNSTVQKHWSLEGLHRQNQKEVLGRSQCKALTSVRCDYFTGFTSSSPSYVMMLTQGASWLGEEIYVATQQPEAHSQSPA